MKKIIILASILVVAAAAFGTYYYNKPRTTAGAVKTDFKLEADILYNEFIANEDAANSKYLGKALEVTGEVVAVDTDERGTMTVILDAGNQAGSVSCQFEKHDPMPAMAEGDHVVVKGFCSGILLDVVLVDCELVSEK